jgi:predicted aspartyl protease
MPETRCGFNDIPGGASGCDLLVSMGPTLFVDIGFDANYRYVIGGPAPIPGMKRLEALVDTGATECCIDSLTAAQLNLPIVDRRRIGGVGGAQEVNIHLAQVHVPLLAFTIFGQFAGVHLQAGGQVHKALLGRTFLKACSMSYDGRTGNVVISKP